MKTTLVACIWSAGLALSAFAQDPTVAPPVPPPTPIASVAPPAAPAATASASAKDDLESRIEGKVRKHFQVTVGDHRHRSDVRDKDTDDLGSLMAIPIVGIIFSTLFGAPVLIVAAIMFFSYLKARSLHRTVRTMVERGQEVPAALFATPPPAVRARSDMRRGVILLMVGLGLMIFFGAADDWEGGAWALGMIPFLMGAGYLTVWKLEGNKPALINSSTDNTPRVP